MKKANGYTPPIILRVCEFSPEGPVLDGSIAANTAVTIDAGEQKVDNYDFSSSSSDFNHTWGE